MKTRILLSSMLLMVLIGSGCSKSSSSPTSSTASTPGANEVWMQNTAFTPATITVPINTTIKWTNKDAIVHTVTSTTGAFDSGNMNSDAVFSHQFTATGSYSYKCLIHSNMTGTVIVQ